MSLKDVHQKYSSLTDKGTAHSYLEFYEKLLSPLVGKSATILEIGVYKGGSLMLWDDYLVNAKIYGIDIRSIPKELVVSERIKYIQVDCTNKDELEKEFEGIEFDVIIDDASHKLDHQISAFNILYPKLKVCGTYVIEDVQVHNFPAYKKLNKNAILDDMRHKRREWRRIGKANNLIIITKDKI